MVKKFRNFKKAYHALVNDAWLNAILGFGCGILLSSFIF